MFYNHTLSEFNLRKQYNGIINQKLNASGLLEGTSDFCHHFLEKKEIGF